MNETTSAEPPILDDPTTLPVLIRTARTGKGFYPTPVMPGTMIDMAIIVDDPDKPEIPPIVSVRDDSTSIGFFLVEQVPRGHYENIVNWSQYRQWIDDSHRLRVQMEMPAGGDIVLNIYVNHQGTKLTDRPKAHISVQEAMKNADTRFSIRICAATYIPPRIVNLVK